MEKRRRGNFRYNIKYVSRIGGYESEEQAETLLTRRTITELGAQLKLRKELSDPYIFVTSMECFEEVE